MIGPLGASETAFGLASAPMTEDIVAAIDRRISEANGQIDQLQKARQRLIEQDAEPPARPRRTRAKRASRRAGPGIVPAGKLTTLLGSSDGMTTAQLASAANGKPDQVRVLLRELEATQQVRRSGQRRSTRWHLITDEDRVAARAAELRALSRDSKR
jgi:hypothetical protein